jgi:hypothetical protein
MGTRGHPDWPPCRLWSLTNMIDRPKMTRPKRIWKPRRTEAMMRLKPNTILRCRYVVIRRRLWICFRGDGVCVVEPMRRSKGIDHYTERVITSWHITQGKETKCTQFRLFGPHHFYLQLICIPVSCVEYDVSTVTLCSTYCRQAHQSHPVLLGTNAACEPDSRYERHRYRKLDRGLVSHRLL